MGAKFYNPYHFVPVEKPDNAQQGVCKKEFPKAKEATHERYVPGTHSGRIVARLTTVTPTVVGGTQTRPPKDYATVEPYRIGGVPAIPGSSLRGLIGSVIEAGTNAPLRVLENRSFSYRKKMETSLSAIGLVVEDKGELKLKPMCLPTLESKDGGRTFPVEAKWKKLFENGPQMKVYFGDKDFIRDPKFPYRTTQTPVDMPVKRLAWSVSGVAADRTLHVKASRYAVAQEADQRDTPRPGRVRVLGCYGRDIPSTKKHELWVPEPEPDAPLLTIPKDVRDRFKALAKERAEAVDGLPYEPRDTRPNRGKNESLELQVGDMVFFDVDDARQVTEFSYSAIWRAQVRHGAHEFFKAIDPGLVPFDHTRETVSPAELLLGFAEDTEEVEDKSYELLSLASRVRFTDALSMEPEAALLDAPVNLKILSSPKPPCPSLYFRKKDSGAYIEKKGLRREDHRPQGRKFYLHAKPGVGRPQWETGKPGDSRDQKNRVQPIRAGKTFHFHIDFDNLTDAELGLLLFGLEPDPAFHHKLGMGKPLGLGSVKLEVLGVFPVERESRYSVAGLRQGRYGTATLTKVGSDVLAKGAWPDRYAAEGSVGGGADLVASSLAELAKKGWLSETATHALALLGNYANAPSAASVRYPTVADQTDKETEHFKWFVFNDGHRERGAGMSPRGQFLKPLDKAKTLPDLEELGWDEPTRRDRW